MLNILESVILQNKTTKRDIKKIAMRPNIILENFNLDLFLVAENGNTEALKEPAKK